MRFCAWASIAMVAVACHGTGAAAQGSATEPVRGVAAASTGSAAASTSVVASASAKPVAKNPAEEAEAEKARAACEADIVAAMNEPALPGAPQLEARRAETFARAKADPVVFVREPAPTGLSVEGDRLRRELHSADNSVKALFDLYPKLQKRRDLARDVFLTEGYVYAASPAFASAMSNLVHPEDLFQEKEIFIQRGADVLQARLKKTVNGNGYEYVDGPEPGARVKLLLFDRVAIRKDGFGAPLHRDVGEVAKELGFDEMRIRRLTERSIVAELRYGDDWIPSLLSAEHERVGLRCEALPAERRTVVLGARIEGHRREAALDSLRTVMQRQVAEGLPFDEPKTEFGQQDGKLRQHWRWAYRQGRTEFDFNEDKYKVFDAKGRPRVPQVCIDFVTDTFERAGGSWYRSRGEPRERTPGRIDFTALGIDNERSVERFIEFAKARPDSFEVEELPERERVPYQKKADFFAHLAAHRERYRPGDIIVIHGLRDDEKMHYHSFFVYSSDPVTGAPSLVAANAGRPRIRPWEGEMLSAPLRSIRARIRPRLPWLEFVTGVSGPPPSAEPAPVPPKPFATNI